MKHVYKSQKTYSVIWETVRQIPKGRVATYGEIAEVNGLARQARLVGYALHNLPRGSKIPWHRVVNSFGKISFRTRSRHHTLQRQLLRKEGVEFSQGKIDLEKYGWLGTLYKHSDKMF